MKHEHKRHGTETSVATRTIDRIARSICAANCAYRGITPCWSIHTQRADAQEWPNPNCNEPGCHSIATDVYMDMPGKAR